MRICSSVGLMPKAIQPIMASLAAASLPSRSRVQSDSASPRPRAAASAASRLFPPSISEITKFDVPFRIPRTERGADAPIRSRSVEITGALPPTAAPKSSAVRFSAASAWSESPWLAISSLLAVINFRPRRNALTAIDRAGSSPPTASTTTSASWSRNAWRSSVNRRASSGSLRSRVVSRTRTVVMTKRTPNRDARDAADSWSSRTSPPPTTPQPASATRIVRGCLSALVSRGKTRRGKAEVACL